MKAKTANASTVLRGYFPDPEDDSPQAQAVIALRTQLHSLGRRYSDLARHVLRALDHPAAKPHDDNTGRPCRFDPLGHDCCEMCNDAESVLLNPTSVPPEKK